MLTKTKTAVSINAIPVQIADDARAHLRDTYGHELHVQVIDGRAPCRLCLRIADTGARMILLSYGPFGADYGPYSEVGPIFIHADACQPYADHTQVPRDFICRDLVLRAYNVRHAIADSVIASAKDSIEVAAKFFENPEIAYVHARHTTYGCFDFKLERA